MRMQHRGSTALVALLASLASMASAYSQCVPYALDAPRYVSPPSATETSVVGVGDFDHDGLGDLVTPHYIVYALARPVRLADEQSTLQAIADVNGDGWPDLIGTPANGGGIRAYVNRGDGSFTTVDSAATTASSIIGSEFNRDGFADLVTVSGNTIEAYLGNGKGSFTRSQSFNGMIRPLVGDFDGDAHTDILASTLTVAPSTPGAFNLLAGDGYGHFSSGIYLDSTVAPRGIGDFDRDGIDDLMIVGTGVWFLHGGSKTLRQIDPFPITTFYWGGALTDLNGDGALDIVVSDEERAVVQTSLNDGTGKFGPLSSFSIRAFSILPADVNGDGLTDLIIKTQSSLDDLVVFIGSGDGRFRTPPRAQASGHPAFSGDFDGDGADDVLLVKSIPAAADVIWNAPVSITGQQVQLPFNTVEATVDLEGDGISKILGRRGNSIIAATLGRDGSSTERARIDALYNVWRVVTGHFLGHARLDVAMLVVKDAQNLEIQVYDFAAPASPARTFPIPADSGGYELAAADLNDDGTDDLIVVGNGVTTYQHSTDPESNGYVMTLLSAGGAFVGSRVYSSIFALFSPTTGDFDGDGVADLVLLSKYFPQGIVWLRGLKDGRFESSRFVTGAGTSYPRPSLKAADIDGDGYDDLIAVDRFSVVLTFGSGQGFTRSAKYALPGAQNAAVVRARGTRTASLLVATDDLAAVLRPSCGRTRTVGRR
jgi:hypothetical protein